MANYWCVWLMCAWSTFFLIHLDMAHVTSTWQQTCHIHFGRDSTVRRAWKPGFRVLPAHKISWTWILHMFGWFVIALDCAHISLDTRENTMWSITTAICTSRKHLLPWWWSNLALLCLWHTDEEGCINWFKLLFRIFLALKIKMQMTILRCWWRRQLY